MIERISESEMSPVQTFPDEAGAGAVFLKNRAEQEQVRNRLFQADFFGF